VGLPYEGMAPSGPLYFLHKAHPEAETETLKHKRHCG
jgi:hypothetical protein